MRVSFPARGKPTASRAVYVSLVCGKFSVSGLKFMHANAESHAVELQLPTRMQTASLLQKAMFD